MTNATRAAATTTSEFQLREENGTAYGRLYIPAELLGSGISIHARILNNVPSGRGRLVHFVAPVGEYERCIREFSTGSEFIQNRTNHLLEQLKQKTAIAQGTQLHLEVPPTQGETEIAQTGLELLADQAESDGELKATAAQLNQLKPKQLKALAASHNIEPTSNKKQLVKSLVGIISTSELNV